MKELLWRGVAHTLRQPVFLRPLIKHGLAHPYTPIVKDDDDLYMDRLWTYNPYPERREKLWMETAGLKPRQRPSARLHLIRREDLDRHKHNHPWPFRVLCLVGGYIMEMEDGTRITVRPGDTYTMTTDQYHSIVSLLDGPAITLFITGEYEGVWGFKVDGQHVPYRQYLGLDK